MQKVRITKRFTFEMAHALLGYDGLCKNIHGHSYNLWVTLIGKPINNENNPKDGMLLDFSSLSKLIKQNITEVYDHSLVLNNKLPETQIAFFKNNFEKIILTDFQPTCENILTDFSKKIIKILPQNVKLYSLKLQETETSFAEWYASDNV